MYRSHTGYLHVKKEVLAQGENMYTVYTATDLYRVSIKVRKQRKR